MRDPTILGPYWVPLIFANSQTLASIALPVGTKQRQLYLGSWAAKGWRYLHSFEAQLNTL